MELPLQRLMMYLILILKKGFNPCFNGTTSATMLTSRRGHLSMKVSILVLMELPLQLYKMADFDGDAQSFNPCFNGTTSATRKSTDIRKR